MATIDRDVTSIIAATGWTGATVANLSTSNDVRATDGTAAEFISAELDNSPADFGSLNSVTLKVEARTVGTVSRAKTVLVELLDSANNILQSFTTATLGGADSTEVSSAFSRSDAASVIDGYRLRCTVQEGGGMADTATVEIDRMWITLDYNVAANVTASPGTGLLTATGFAAAVIIGTVVSPGVGVVTATGFAPTVSVSVSKLETLTDNFDDNSLDSGKWSVTAGGGTVTEQNQRLELAGDANPDQPIVRSTATYDLTASSAFARISNFEDGGNARFGAEDASGDLYFVRLFGTGITFRKVISSVETQVGGGLTYSPTTHAWLRVRESGGTIFADTATASADNPPTAGQWTNRWSQATDAGFDPTNVKAYMLLFVASGTNKAIYVDGFNTSTGAQTVTPGVGAATLTGFAPTVTTGSGSSVTPGTGVATLAGFAPTVTASDHQTAATDVGVLTATGFAPVVQIGVTVTTDVGAATLAGLAPTVTATEHQTAEPGAGVATLAGFAPTVTASDHKTVTPDVGALTLVGFAPVVSAGTGAAPGAGQLLLTGFEPTVSTTANVTAEPGVGVATLVGLAPIVTASDHQTVNADVGALTLTGFAPTVELPVSVTTGVGALVATGFEPTVSVSDHQAVSTAVGVLTLTGYEPTITTGGETIVEPGVGALTVVGYAPSVDIGAIVRISVASGGASVKLTVVNALTSTMTAVGGQSVRLTPV